MSQLDQIVDVVISLQSVGVPKPGFGIPLVLGPTGFSNSDIIRFYSSAAQLLEDGFLSSSPEYKHAQTIFDQDIPPLQIAVGKRLTAVAQIDTITPTAINNHLYKVTIDGVDYSFTSDGSATVSEIVAGLLALINADLTAPCTASGSSTLILTANVAGAGFTTSINADVNMVLVHTTSSYGIANDIAAVSDVNDSWYCLILTSKTKADILQAAAYIEGVMKIFIADSDDSDVPTTATTDVMSLLKSLGYNRSALLYTLSSSNLQNGPGAGWAGGQLPQVPGSNTWKFKQIANIAPDAFTGTQRNTIIGNPPAGIIGKNGNVYETVGGVNITEEGWMASGRFIDVTIGIDWLKTEIQTNIYQLLVSNPKIPYTNKGATLIYGAILQAIKQGIANGLIDGGSPYEITTPDVLSESANDRANRYYPDVSFECRFAGAFHFIKVSGVVTQ